MFYRLCAENLRNGGDVARALQKAKYDVCFAGRDESFYTIVIAGTEEQAEAVRDEIWERNYGAYCSVNEITGDQLDEMF